MPMVQSSSRVKKMASSHAWPDKQKNKALIVDISAIYQLRNFTFWMNIWNYLFQYINDLQLGLNSIYLEPI